jgi:hypothetical protein
MVKKYFLLINVIIGFSCSSVEKKEEVLDSAIMVEILTEIHILEANVERQRIKGDSGIKVFNSLEKEVFSKFNTDKAAYEKSYKYYVNHPKELKDIYSVVVDSLNVIQKRGYNDDQEKVKAAESLRDKRKPKEDSIRQKKNDSILK